jgi:hypothetical protein
MKHSDATAAALRQLAEVTRVKSRFADDALRQLAEVRTVRNAALHDALLQAPDAVTIKDRFVFSDALRQLDNAAATVKNRFADEAFRQLAGITTARDSGTYDTFRQAADLMMVRSSLAHDALRQFADMTTGANSAAQEALRQLAAATIKNPFADDTIRRQLDNDETLIAEIQPDPVIVAEVLDDDPSVEKKGKPLTPYTNANAAGSVEIIAPRGAEFRLAAKVFDVVSAVVPERIANEELGDALEEMQRRMSCGGATWWVYVKLASTLFWISMNAVREIAAALLGKSRPKHND